MVERVGCPSELAVRSAAHFKIDGAEEGNVRATTAGSVTTIDRLGHRFSSITKPAARLAARFQTGGAEAGDVPRGERTTSLRVG